LTCGIDWLTVSKPKARKKLQEILEEISALLRSTHEGKYGGHGYRGVDVALYGKLLTRGDDILVELPGQAMQHVRETLRIPDAELCRWFAARGFKATRIDITIDTQDARVNPAVVQSYWDSGDVVTDVRNCEPRQKHERGKGAAPDGAGATVYIGATKSDRFARVYDKAAEARFKTGEILCDETGREIEHLTRFELENRHDTATGYVNKCFSKGVFIPETIRERMVALESEIRDTKASLSTARENARPPEKLSAERFVAVLRKVLTSGNVDAEKRRAVVRTLVKEVVVSDSRIELVVSDPGDEQAQLVREVSGGSGPWFAEPSHLAERVGHE
jgi:hypothetical protein